MVPVGPSQGMEVGKCRAEILVPSDDFFSSADQRFSRFSIVQPSRPPISASALSAISTPRPQSLLRTATASLTTVTPPYQIPGESGG